MRVYCVCVLFVTLAVAAPLNAGQIVDPSTGSIVWFLFDDYGFPPVDPARGGWKDGCLELVKSTPRGVGRTQLELSEQGLVYTVDFTPPGANEPMVVARSTLRRV